MNFKQILKKIDFWKKKDKKIQKLYDEFNNVFCSSSCKPIIEQGLVDSFIEGLILISNNKNLKNDLEYYAYEMKDDFYVKFKGKKYYKKDFHEYLDLAYNK